MRIYTIAKRIAAAGAARRFSCAGLMFILIVLWSSPSLAVGAPLKFSASHWLKSIPAPPTDVHVAEAICPDVRAMPMRIGTAEAEANELVGDGAPAMETMVVDMMRGGYASMREMTILRELADLERERHAGSRGFQPERQLRAKNTLEELRRELDQALRRVGDGLPACSTGDEKRGFTVDAACLESNRRTVEKRTVRAYNSYLHQVQEPLSVLRKEVLQHIGTEDSIRQIESQTESALVHDYLLSIRAGLLYVVRDYAGERSNTCVYPDWQQKEAHR